MKDNHRREWFLSMGFMVNTKCSCCNWTLHGKRKINKRVINKKVRAREKQELNTRLVGD